MAQNIYDDPNFFAGYSQLARSVHGLAGAAEWPQIQAVLPPLAGKQIVDLGCGYGWFSRWASEQGAAHVLALDISAKMLARATELGQDGVGWPIEYVQADLAAVQLPRERFDLAYSSLAFHYIADLAPLFATIFQSLRSGAQLIFTIEHPMYQAAKNADWVVDAAGNRAWPVNDYQLEGERTSNWLADGVIKYHRTLGTLLNSLIVAGFSIAHVNEWGPSAEQLAQQPALIDEVHRPMLLIVAASKLI